MLQQQILLPYDSGGLNVGSLKYKNLGLLVKWWWKFLNNNTNSLWVRVIKSLYGNNGGLGCITPLPESKLKKLSGRTWFNILNVEHTLSKLGCDISNAFVKVLGNGAATSFWDDKWCDSVTLKAKYPKLFRLEKEKDATVNSRISRLDADMSFNWAWFSPPKWRAETELFHLEDQLKRFAFSGDKEDKWTWKFSPNSSYSVTSLVNLLSELETSNLPNPIPTQVNKLIPQKIGIFIWRAKQNRLPVRSELDLRGIDLHSTRCPVCDDSIETLDHLMFHCNKAKDIWNRISNWWDINDLNVSNLSELAAAKNQNIKTSTGSSIWQAIIWITGFHIWKNRNDTVFGKPVLSSPKIVSNIQANSFEWIHCRCNKLNLNWLQWITNPKIFDANPAPKAGIG
ncbi:uncharacterized protein [Rutidosis leptorrhynchoides]|uniref:uncharacterized protein n=1 Tax=Rutidosis leptorrhynchoides TaxID=125765 RepID=UPI003A98DE5A